MAERHFGSRTKVGEKLSLEFRSHFGSSHFGSSHFGSSHFGSSHFGSSLKPFWLQATSGGTTGTASSYNCPFITQLRGISSQGELQWLLSRAM